MKIGILTQPLHHNYGGLLQAWALQRVLFNMGHEAIIINREPIAHKKKVSLWKAIKLEIKKIILKATGEWKSYIPVTESLRKKVEINVVDFKKKRYRGISPDIKTDKELSDYIAKETFDAYIVGSDQVWRPIYSPNLMTYFLDFIKDNSQVKKIAYAASFGVDNWELNAQETQQARELAPLFDLITVREDSGVRLVEDKLECKATHVLDPTFLLNKEDYMRLVNQSTIHLRESNGDLFCYVLDRTLNLSSVISECSSQTGLKPFYCNYLTPIWQLENIRDINKCIVPPVEQWLKSFIDAKIVITDSFHGVVFSIIFNKPFWVVANVNRGFARFSSLLKLFGLEDRIVSIKSQIDWGRPINWEPVNNKRSSLADFSKSLLNSYLN